MRALPLLYPLLVLILAACTGGGDAAQASPGGAAAQQAPRMQGGPTAQDVQDLITRRETASATGTGGVHSGVSLDYQEVTFGEPRAATERDRVVNGITGPMVYPVRVRYTSNRTWGNGQTEARPIYYDYEFFRDAMGGWDVYLVGPVR